MSGTKGRKAKNEAVETEELRFVASKSAGPVSAILMRPAEARSLLVLAHGAGAGMRHAFLERVARGFADRGVATFRYQFPYFEKDSGKGWRRPDPRPVLLATVRAAVAAAAQAAPRLPRFAGGKSMGGRMTSLAAADEPLADVRGLVFFGFPLHPAGRPATERGEHLADVSLPMLFLQGTRDKLCELDLLRPIVGPLAATLHVEEEADHGFSVLKRSGRNDDDVMDAILDTATRWMDERC